MKRLRMLSAVGVAALVVVAFAGADSAAASWPALCKENLAQCPSGSLYGSATALEANLRSGSAFEVRGAITLSCTSSTMKGQTTGRSSSGVTAEISSFSVGSCEPKCTAEAANLPYKATFTSGSGGNGGVTLSSGGSGAPKLNLKCGLVKCALTASSLGFNFTGGKPANMKAVEDPATGCGGEAGVNVAYDLSSPSPAFATSATPAFELCKASESPCAAANRYHSGESIRALLNGGHLWAPGFNCSQSSLSLKLESESTKEGEPLGANVTGWEWGLCSAGCVVKNRNLNWQSEVIDLGEDRGQLVIHNPTWFAECGGSPPFSCTIRTGQMTLDLTGGEHPILTVSEEPVEGGYCGNNPVSATLYLTSPVYFSD